MKVGDLVVPGNRGNGRGHNPEWIGMIIRMEAIPIGYYIRVLWNDGVEKLHLKDQIMRYENDID